MSVSGQVRLDQDRSRQGLKRQNRSGQVSRVRTVQDRSGHIGKVHYMTVQGRSQQGRTRQDWISKDKTGQVRKEQAPVTTATTKNQHQNIKTDYIKYFT